MPNGLHPLRTRTATVVVSGDDVFEDLFTAASELQGLLGDEGFAARLALGTAVFERADGAMEGRGADDLIVLYTAGGTFTAQARRGLERAVHAGAGLIAVHSANVPGGSGVEGGSGGKKSLLAADPLLSLIGSRYISHGPPPHESRFSVRLDGGHEVAAGIAPFDVTHEHYHLETAPDARVLAWREAAEAADAAESGGAEPVVHVRTHGAGRVCYIQLGHDLRIWGEPPVRQLVRRAARWACRRAARGV